MSESDPTANKGEITRLLVAHRDGDRAAFEQLVPLVYDDLRRIARRQRSDLWWHQPAVSY